MFRIPVIHYNTVDEAYTNRIYIVSGTNDNLNCTKASSENFRDAWNFVLIKAFLKGSYLILR